MYLFLITEQKQNEYSAVAIISHHLECGWSTVKEKYYPILIKYARAKRSPNIEQSAANRFQRNHSFEI